MGNGATRESGGTVRGRVLIGGDWFGKEERLESWNPATGELLGSVPLCNAGDVAMAVEAAGEAGPAWASLPLNKRFGLLEILGNLVREEGDALASLITQECGKPLPEAHFVEVLGVLDFLAGLVRDGPALLRESRVPRLSNPLLWSKSHRVRRLPLGVLGVISPWNLPLSIPMGQILPALAAGNTVVFKPSELTPLVGVKIAALFKKSGFPPGVFNCVTGGREVGKSLVEGRVDGILFTGSTATGRAIQASAAKRFLTTAMELGGKDAFLVLEDVNVERCVNGAVWSGCFGSGQSCSSSERYFVPEEMAGDFSRRVAERVGLLRLGDGMEDGIDIGPMICAPQREKVAVQVAEAVAAGARLLCGGRKVEGAGFFYEPTVLADVPLDCALMQEETFGPVIPIVSYRDLEEVIGWCNDTPYGLSASIWTSDMKKGRRLAERLDVGTVWINDASYSHSQPSLPWGGRKASGCGGTHWLGVLHELTTPQVIGWDSGKRAREVWWFPYTINALNLARNWRFFSGEGFLVKFMHAIPLFSAFLKAREDR